MKQRTFSDLEYSNRRGHTRRDVFLSALDGLIPWEKWVSLVTPYYYKGRRGRKPRDPEVMLRMYFLQKWFSLSAAGTEEAVSDSYSMRAFLGINFIDEQVPDATTLQRFRRILKKHGLDTVFEDELDRILADAGKMIHPGAVLDPAVRDVKHG